MHEAILQAERSHDAETQCGCVLVKDNTILSGGYNGFIRDIDDTVLPNRRPYKYPYMIHAELNAIFNCARQGKSTLDAICYVTTKPCLSCFQYLWQAGIVKIVYTNWRLSRNYNHNEADNQIEALHRLMNPNIPILSTYNKNMRMSMQFIPTSEFLDKQGS